MVHKLGLHHSWRCMLLVVLIYLKRSLLLSLSLHITDQSTRPSFEFRGSSLVSSLRPWARRHVGRGQIGG